MKYAHCSLACEVVWSNIVHGGGGIGATLVEKLMERVRQVVGNTQSRANN